MSDRALRLQLLAFGHRPHRVPNHISKTVLPTVKIGPPDCLLAARLRSWGCTSLCVWVRAYGID